MLQVCKDQKEIFFDALAPVAAWENMCLASL